VKPILKEECEKRGKKYMKGALTVEKATSVYGLLYMPLNKLENIKKTHKADILRIYGINFDEEDGNLATAVKETRTEAELNCREGF
jgi:hypothetical protein